MSDWTPADGPMPALYLGHGAPPLLDDALWTAELAGWAPACPARAPSSSCRRTGRPRR